MSCFWGDEDMESECSSVGDMWPWHPFCDSCEIRQKTESRDGDAEEDFKSMPGSFDLVDRENVYLWQKVNSLSAVK